MTAVRAPERAREIDLGHDADVGLGVVARSARWTFLSLVAKQGSRVVFSIFLARLLGPESFGVIGQATIYLAFAAIVLDVGLGASLVQRARIDRRDIGTATTVNVGICIALAALTLVVAPLWAAFFDTPELTSVLRVLSVTFLVNGLAVVPRALLVRRLEFRLLGVAEVLGALGGGAAGLVAASRGADHWALVIQTLVTDALFLAILLAVTGAPVLAWSRRALSDMAGFSRNVFGSQLVSFAGQHTDNLLVGWWLGATALAYYALSYRLLMLPVQLLAHSANRLVFPVFSRLNGDQPRQARAFLDVTTSLALVATPVMVLTSLAAPAAVPLVFGDEWRPAIGAMQVLAIGGIMRVVLTPSSAVLMALGRADWLFRWNVVAVPIHVVGFAIGLQWGIEGVAWSYLGVGVPLGAALNRLVLRQLGTSSRAYLAALRPAATGSMACAATWLAVAAALEGAPVVVALGAGAGASLVAFGAIVLFTETEVAREQLTIVRSVLGRSNKRPARRGGAPDDHREAGAVLSSESRRETADAQPGRTGRGARRGQNHPLAARGRRRRRRDT